MSIKYLAKSSNGQFLSVLKKNGRRTRGSGKLTNALWFYKSKGWADNPLGSHRPVLPIRFTLGRH